MAPENTSEMFKRGYNEFQDGTIPHLPSQSGIELLYTREELDDYEEGWQCAFVDQNIPY